MVMHVYNRNFICLYNNDNRTNFVWIARTNDKVDELRPSTATSWTPMNIRQMVLTE